MPNAEIKNNNKKKININPPASKSYREGEKWGQRKSRARCCSGTEEASCMITHVPTRGDVEVSTGLAVNNSPVSVSSSHSCRGCLIYEGSMRGE